MSWPYQFGEAVTVLDGHAVGVDSDGNDVATYPVKATHQNCAVWPADGNGTGGNEDTDARDTVIAGLAVVLPPNADVQPVDRLVIRGETWEVVGDPQSCPSPLTAWHPGLPVAVKKVTG